MRHATMRKTILLAILAVPIFAVLLYAFAARKPAPKYQVGYDFGPGKIESRELVWGSCPGRLFPHFYWTYMVSFKDWRDTTKHQLALEEWPGFTRPFPATSGARRQGKSTPDAADSTETAEGSTRNR